MSLIAMNEEPDISQVVLSPKTNQELFKIIESSCQEELIKQQEEVEQRCKMLSQ